MQRRILQGQYAGFLSRAAALIIDMLFIFISIIVVTWFVTTLLNQFLGLDVSACPANTGTRTTLIVYLCEGSRIFLWGFGLLFGPVYFIALWTLTGQTIGKYIMGVRIVRLNGRHVNLLTAIIRYIGYFVSLIPFGLGFLRVLISDRRRGWHDMMAGTCVIYAWEAHQNERFLDRAKQYVKRRRREAKTSH
jgi:uncharacterized RDD family membrane protein YckC